MHTSEIISEAFIPSRLMAKIRSLITKHKVKRNATSQRLKLSHDYSYLCELGNWSAKRDILETHDMTIT